MPPESPARLPPDVEDVLCRCARVHAAARLAFGRLRGLALLRRCAVESVAVALGVHPGVVERARALLEDRQRRVVTIAAYLAAADAAREDIAQPGEHAEAPPPCCRDLIRIAQGRPGGLELLSAAPLETAAVMFGVHPRLVLEARETLPR